MSWGDDDFYGVPNGWTSRKLGDVAKVVGGGTPKTSDPANFSAISGHPWITPADLTGYTQKYISRGRRFLSDSGLKNSSARYLPAGSVLFSSRAPIGHIAIAANPLTTNQGFRSFVPNGELDPSFLYYALKHLTPLAQSRASGTTFPELSGSKAAQLPIAYPDRTTQERLAKLLDQVGDAARVANDHLGAARQIITRLRQSILAAACSGRLTSDWRGASGTQPRPVSSDDDSTDPDYLPRLPNGWSWMTPDDLRVSDRAITYGVIKLGSEVRGGVPTLRSSDVRLLRIDESGVKSISPKIADNYARTFIRGGEVLVTVRGSLGGVAVARDHMRGWNISREVAMIPITAETLPDYVALAIANPRSQQWINSVTKGVTYTGINIRDLKRLPLPIPSLEEQREILKRVEALFSLADSVAKNIDVASRTAQNCVHSALAKAFEGDA